MCKLRIAYLVLLMAFGAMYADTSFIAIDAQTGIAIRSVGPSLDQRVAPCCTFNIVLSLVGYEVGILQDTQQPCWAYDGSPVATEGQRNSLSPKTWMTTSAVWYSKRLASSIGQKTLQNYLVQFFYGNQDLWGRGGKDGFISAHESSTLMIAPNEQIRFIQRLVTNSLPISAHAVQMTKKLLYDHTLPSGWALYGKTGSGFYLRESNKLAWYVGWIEKGTQQYPFVLLITGVRAFPSKEERQEIVKQFFKESLRCEF